MEAEREGSGTVGCVDFIGFKIMLIVSADFATLEVVDGGAGRSGCGGEGSLGRVNCVALVKVPDLR